jgi:zinc/manganese transport system substrate-binding protein/zinc transport system substrate-binding protein/manganese/iron transport system substrate-binding protein
MRATGARAVLVEPTTPRAAAETLAARTGVRVAVVAASVGALPEVPDYLALFEHDVGVLATALAGGGS